jgi:hypothetical protein
MREKKRLFGCLILSLLTMLFSCQTQSDQNIPLEQLAAESYTGLMTIEGPNPAVVRTYGTWTASYTAGKSGIKPGGGIRIGLRHFNHLWTKIQDTDPLDDGYVIISSPPGVPTTSLVKCDNWSEKFFFDYFPVQNVIEVLVGEPGLEPGQSLSITYGDRSAGSKGMLLQPFDETNYMFKTFVDVDGDQNFLLLEESPTIRISSDEAAGITLIMKSNAIRGKPVSCLLRVEDRLGNPATGYTGTVQLTSPDSTVRLPSSYTFKQADQGAHWVEDIIFSSEGNYIIEAADSNLHARSNPVLVTAAPPEYSHLWGDIHGHTISSDGRGSVEEYYDFARNYSALDFCAVTDHGFELTNENWARSKAVTNRKNEPGRFITFNANEWSGKMEDGGDHNIYWLDENPPVFRSTLYYNPRNIQMDHDLEAKTAHITDVYREVKEYLHDKNVMIIPHRGGRAANPEWHDPDLERLIETYCEHFRSTNWSSKFLRKGYRLGMMASGDGHYGNPGYGYLFPQRQELVGEGLIAVLSQEQTRKSIFTAMYDRHCYATTGDRIILDFRVDGHLMGSEYSTTSAPKIKVKAAGTTLITLISIRRNGESVHTIEPNEITAELSWKDPDFDPDAKGVYYDVLVVQENDEEALSSPVWLN